MLSKLRYPSISWVTADPSITNSWTWPVITSGVPEDEDWCKEIKVTLKVCFSKSMINDN